MNVATVKVEYDDIKNWSAKTCFGEPAGEKSKLTLKPELTLEPVPNDDQNKTELAVAVSKGVENRSGKEDMKSNQDFVEDWDQKVQEPAKDSKLVLQDVIDNFVKVGIPDFWVNRFEMQNAYTVKEKGWKVQVRWGQSPIIEAGVGVFVTEDVQKGQLIRRARNGKNLIQFWERAGLPKEMSPSTKVYISNYCCQVEDNFVCIFIPGCCYNHSSDPNVEMIIPDEETIHVAAKNITAGTEILGDYYSFGEPLKYLKELAKNEKMELVFPGYNLFL